MSQDRVGFSVQYFACQFCVIVLTTSLMYSLVQAHFEDLDPIVVPRSYKDYIGSNKDKQIYFIGKRNTANGKDKQLYFIGKRNTATKMTCKGYLECPSDHCCAYGDDVKQLSFLFPLIKPQPYCQPMGSVGDLCYSSRSQEVAFGCGCSPGNACVTFVGYPYGICVEDRK